MYKYRVAICEDEDYQLQHLVQLLEKVSRENNLDLQLDTFTSGEALIERGHQSYDIIILDILLPSMSGIDAAKMIRQQNKEAKIIFVTAIEQYWPEGFKVNAYRYLIKPIDEESFCEEIKAVIDELSSNKEFVLIRDEGTLVKLLISDIYYLEIVNRKVLLYTLQGVYTTSYSIGVWTEYLTAYGFGSPHKSYLVNLEHVVALDKEKVTLSNGQDIYTSQRKSKEFKERLTRFLGQL